MDDDATRAVIVAAARTYAPELYLSALLAPRAHRDDLVVLAAFEGEIDRIPREVKDPMLGEIRLQWWRDRIERAAPGDNSGHPVADAVAGVVRQHGLERSGLIDSIDARSPLGGPDGDGGALGGERRQCGFDAAAMIRAAAVLGVKDPVGEDRAFLVAAGRALTAVRDGMGQQARRAQGEIAAEGAEAEATRRGIAAALAEGRTCLEEARALAGGRSRALRHAALPVALVEPYLRALQEAADDPGGREAAISPLARVWRLWRAHRTGRF
jgi:phytoene synthase